MKILVIGDSIGLPHFHHLRDKVETAYDNVYPERLRRLLLACFSGDDVLMLNQCRHANTSYALRCGATNEVLFVRPDVLILQLGMADLWPCEGRNVLAPFPELEGRDPWVSAEQFHDNFSHFLDFCFEFDSLSVIIVNIPRVSDEQYERHPTAMLRTQDYNRILHDLAVRRGISFVDAFHLFEQLGATAFGSDGIHPAHQASVVLAENILQHISRVNSISHDSNCISSGEPL
jgi:lysophospholipase L1-like esterase